MQVGDNLDGPHHLLRFVAKEDQVPGTLARRHPNPQRLVDCLADPQDMGKEGKIQPGSAYGACSTNRTQARKAMRVWWTGSRSKRSWSA